MHRKRISNAKWYDRTCASCARFVLSGSICYQRNDGVLEYLCPYCDKQEQEAVVRVNGLW